MAPRALRSMKEFDPGQPGVLHDAVADRMIPWTGELRADWMLQAERRDDGTVAWKGTVIDGWAEALGG